MSAISCLLPPFGDESAGLLGQPCLRTWWRACDGRSAEREGTHGPRLV